VERTWLVESEILIGEPFSFLSNLVDLCKGQLGLGNEIATSNPTKIEMFSSAVRIWCGGFFSMVLDSNHDLWGFGSNEDGELGLDTLGKITTPTQLTGIDVREVYPGSQHCILVDVAGLVYGCGFNDRSQLGLQSIDLASPVRTPAQVETLMPFKRISNVKSAKKI
jgi:alpha-tubulin suppressor-like RCC1 family protein